MQRIAAVLVLLLAGLSLLVSTEAYEVARPVNPVQVPIVSTEQGALQVDAGPNNPFGMVTSSGGRLVLNMTKGPAGSGYGFAANSSYTLNKIIHVTNTTGSAKNVSVTITGNTVASVTVTGHVGGAAGATSPPFALPANQFVDINLRWATASAGSDGLTITVTGN